MNAEVTDARYVCIFISDMEKNNNQILPKLKYCLKARYFVNISKISKGDKYLQK